MIGELVQEVICKQCNGVFFLVAIIFLSSFFTLVMCFAAMTLLFQYFLSENVFGWSFALIVIVLVSVIAFLANTHYINARSLTNLFSQFGNGVSSFVLHCDAWHVLLAVVATVVCVFFLTLMIQQTAIHVWIANVEQFATSAQGCGMCTKTYFIIFPQ